MLKFINHNGDLRYVLLDDGTEPESTKSKKIREALRAAGIADVEIDENDAVTKKDIKLTGISQDDRKHILGE